MHLKALTGGGPKIPLAVFGTEVIKEAEEVGWEFARWLFEAEHELEVLGFALFFAVGLHV